MTPRSGLTDYFRTIARASLLSASEEVQLAEAARAGSDTARSRLVQANLRLVVSIAKQYQRRGMAFDDLVQEGNVGLLKAVDRYDPNRGFRFATYASYWIKQSIGEALVERGRTIRLPYNAVRTLTSVRRAQEALGEALRRPPTLDELSLETGMARIVLDHLLTIARGPDSLARPVGDGADSELGELLADEQLDPPDMQAISALRRTELFALLGSLDGISVKVLALRYGLGGAPQLNLREIGERMSMSRARVMHVERAALEQLRRRAAAA